MVSDVTVAHMELPEEAFRMFTVVSVVFVIVAQREPTRLVGKSSLEVTSGMRSRGTRKREKISRRR
jgi:hypothetical protein